jgi:hypothetical protein
MTASPPRIAIVLAAALGLASPARAQQPAPRPDPARPATPAQPASGPAPGSAPGPASRPAPRPAAPAAAVAARQPAAKLHTLTVKQDQGFINVALKANAAKVNDVAADLARQTKIRVVVGPIFATETITADFPESALESALTAIAPHAIVDYEFRADARPRPQVIYLLAPTDEAPTANVTTRGASQGLMIQGHTEEPSASEDPVVVTGDARGLTVKATKQPLALVAMFVSDILGVQLEMQYDAVEPVEIDAQNLSPEDVVTSLSPNARLHVRVDLSRGDRTPLRLALVKAGGR